MPDIDIDIEGPLETVERQIDIDAAPEEVWEAVSTDTGREAWLEPDPDRRIHVETSEEPSRLVWWWWSEADLEPAHRVEIRIAELPDGGGSRVRVIETEPRLPVGALCGSLAGGSPRGVSLAEAPSQRASSEGTWLAGVAA